MTLSHIIWKFPSVDYLVSKTDSVLKNRFKPTFKLEVPFRQLRSGFALVPEPL